MNWTENWSGAFLKLESIYEPRGINFNLKVQNDLFPKKNHSVQKKTFCLFGGFAFVKFKRKKF